MDKEISIMAMAQLMLLNELLIDLEENLIGKHELQDKIKKLIKENKDIINDYI